MSEASIIEEIEEARISRGMSVTQLTDKLGMSYATYYRWAQGKASLTLSLLLKVMDELGLTLAVHRRARNAA